MVYSRKPIDIIEDVLLNIAYGLDCGDAVRAEDVIDALEQEGWFFVWDGTSSMAEYAQARAA